MQPMPSKLLVLPILLVLLFGATAARADTTAAPSPAAFEEATESESEEEAEEESTPAEECEEAEEEFAEGEISRAELRETCEPEDAQDKQNGHQGSPASRECDRQRPRHHRAAGAPGSRRHAMAHRAHRQTRCGHRGRHSHLPRG
jgi:hypothetical protein